MPRKKPPATDIYKLHLPAGGAKSPVVFDNPHSGTGLPDHFRFACAPELLMRGYDAHVEKLLEHAPAQGVPVIEALLHRAYIDLNRHEYELDPRHLRDEWKKAHRITAYTRGGLGVYPTRVGVGYSRDIQIYCEDTRPSAADIEHRLKTAHLPYHGQLKNLLDEARTIHGIAIHFTIHSMKRFQPPPQGTADIVIGDMKGKSCDPAFTKFTKEFFEREGFSVALNEPFWGAALVQKHGRPSKGRHSLQIEMARDLYMDQQTLEYLPEKAQRLKDALTKFAAEINAFALDYAAARAEPVSNTPSQQRRKAASTAAKPGS